MKILSAVRHSGISYHSRLQNFSDAEELIANEIGWALHLNKKEFLEKIYSSPIIDEHELMLQFSRDSWSVIKNCNKKIIGISEIWSVRSFWEWLNQT